MNHIIKKILVPIDGSNMAKHALNFALDLAKKYSADIMITSVINPPSSILVAQGMVFTPSIAENYVNRLTVFHKKILLEALNKAKKSNPKINISKKILSGRPADKIVELAKEKKIDLIVIGSRGLGEIEEFFLGSVSDRVADEAPCPVLIVKS